MTEKLPLNASLIHLLGLGLTTLGLIVAGTLWASDIRSEMRVTATGQAVKIEQLERQMQERAIDHDVLIEIRSDLKQLRATLEHGQTQFKDR